jgi:hypothetical protein
MKPFDYKERLRVLREGLDAEVAEYIFRAKGESYEQIAGRFNTNVDNVKKIARNAGIARGKGWRVKA